MHIDTPAAAPPAEADGRFWFQLLGRYHWFVLLVASLGWLFDCMDQRIFIASRQAALTELLGFKVQQGESGPEYVRLDGRTLTSEAQARARDDITWFSGLATTVFMLGWATGGLFFGVMGDRWGRARTMLLTILVYSVFTGLTALSQSWWDFMGYRFLTGMGVGGEFAAGVALLAETMPARARPYALGLLQALSALGNIAGSLLSWGFLTWRQLFLVGIVPALLVVLVMRRLKEPERWRKTVKELDVAGHAAAGEAPPGATGAGGPAPPERSLGSIGDMLREPRWRYHTIIGVLLAVAGVIGLWGVGFWTFELVTKALRALRYDEADINRVKAVGTALQDVGAFFGIWAFSLVAGLVGRRVAFAFGFTAALLATFLVFGTLQTEADVYWMLPLLGFCNLAVFGGYAIYFPELYPTRLRSTGTGFCYNVARYLAAVGPFTLGYLVAWYGTVLTADATDPTLPFRYATLTVACIYVLGLLVLPFAPETKGKPLPE
jgi:MFS family permease